MTKTHQKIDIDKCRLQIMADKTSKTEADTFKPGIPDGSCNDSGEAAKHPGTKVTRRKSEYIFYGSDLAGRRADRKSGDKAMNKVRETEVAKRK